MYSWNVNGYRAVLRKNFQQWLQERTPALVCLQETKVRPDQLGPAELRPLGLEGVFHPSLKRQGYSGTACLWRADCAPLAVETGLDEPGLNGEGRLIRLEYPGFHLLNCYFPNGQGGPERLAFKMAYYDAFLDLCLRLEKDKPVIFCGDVNTAHTEIDLKNPKANATVSGFLPGERAWIDRVIQAGYVDAFRLFESGGGRYTWWSYLRRARERNAGWRIDYFFVSRSLQEQVRGCWIEDEVMGSDHCPVGLELTSAGCR